MLHANSPEKSQNNWNAKNAEKLHAKKWSKIRQKKSK